MCVRFVWKCVTLPKEQLAREPSLPFCLAFWTKEWWVLWQKFEPSGVNQLMKWIYWVYFCECFDFKVWKVKLGKPKVTQERAFIKKPRIYLQNMFILAFNLHFAIWPQPWEECFFKKKTFIDLCASKHIFLLGHESLGACLLSSNITELTCFKINFSTYSN